MEERQAASQLDRKVSRKHESNVASQLGGKVVPPAEQRANFKGESALLDEGESTTRKGTKSDKNKRPHRTASYKERTINVMCRRFCSVTNENLEQT